MCWWQRYPHFAALALALLAFALPALARPLAMLAALAVLASGLIGAFHAGVEYHWWEGPTACTASALGNGTDPLVAIMAAPVVRCDVPQWELFGVSLAGWNFLISTAAALVVLWLLAQSQRTAR
jgi:disulfide bond formation protein DsbB